MFLCVVPEFVVEKGHVEGIFDVGVLFGEELFEERRYTGQQVSLFFECAFLLAAGSAKFFVHIVEDWDFVGFISDVLEWRSDVDLDELIGLGLIIYGKVEWMLADIAGTRLS